MGKKSAIIQIILFAGPVAVALLSVFSIQFLNYSPAVYLASIILFLFAGVSCLVYSKLHKLSEGHYISLGIGKNEKQLQKYYVIAYIFLASGLFLSIIMIAFANSI